MYTHAQPIVDSKNAIFFMISILSLLRRQLTTMSRRTNPSTPEISPINQSIKYKLILINLQIMMDENFASAHHCTDA
jgi:hypothetical protein